MAIVKKKDVAELACLIAASTSVGLAAQLRKSIATAGKVTGKTFADSIIQSYPVNGLANQFYTDRRHHNKVGSFRNQPSYQTTSNTNPKKYWSERDKKLDDYKVRIRNLGHRPNDTKKRRHLAQIEGTKLEFEGVNSEDENVIDEALLAQLDLLDNDLPESS
ncbi:hypothetical protein HI914_04881 [Erysiphe necator]|nr:hypothetical protein HI914_04881 [Erysiphe necator]